MIPTWTFRQLLGLPTEHWTSDRLHQVSGNELTDLCCLVGIPYSGTKPEKISRLLTQTEIQRRLRGYGLKQGDQPTVEQIQAFANTYKGKELKEMSLTKLCGGKPARADFALPYCRMLCRSDQVRDGGKPDQLAIRLLAPGSGVLCKGKRSG